MLIIDLTSQLRHSQKSPEIVMTSLKQTSVFHVNLGCVRILVPVLELELPELSELLELLLANERLELSAS